MKKNVFSVVLLATEVDVRTVQQNIINTVAEIINAGGADQQVPEVDVLTALINHTKNNLTLQPTSIEFE